jgi:hypothetical protein
MKAVNFGDYSQKFAISFCLLMFEFSRNDASLWQSVAKISALEWAVRSLLAVDHQVIEIQHLPCPRIVPVVFGIIAQIVVFHDDLVSVLLVFGEFVDCIAN